MPLFFAAGPLVATPAPTSGHLVVASRSPLTGTVGDASLGGRLVFQIKKAGYDAVVIKGRAEQWTGVTIEDGHGVFTAGKFEYRDAFQRLLDVEQVSFNAYFEHIRKMMLSL